MPKPDLSSLRVAAYVSIGASVVVARGVSIVSRAGAYAISAR